MPTRKTRSGASSGEGRGGRIFWALAIVFSLLSAALGALVFFGGGAKIIDKARWYWPGQRVTLSVPEGFDRFQIASRVEAAGICPRAAFLSATEDRAALDALAVSGASAEGYLFPATYDFLIDTDAARVVERLVRETKKRLERIRASSTDTTSAIVLNEHDWITLASIVEKETGAEDERPLVAQVFLNRLAAPLGETNGRLQSDPTAAYGCLLAPSLASCRGFAGRVTPEMVRDPNNSYNTYRRAGLTPGPIANPGEGALRAVVAPAGGDALYFVADGTGKHVFSRTYEEHLRAIERARLSGPSNASAPH